jgi:4-hydroxybenzoate polyprenyltransferase
LVKEATGSVLLLLIRVSRPVTWLCFPAFFGIGFIASHAPFTPLAAVNLVLLVFLAPLIGFGVNDVYDYKTDVLNKRKKSFPVYGKSLEPQHHSLILKAALVSTLILIAFSAFTRSLTHLLATAVALAAAWGYSLPPVRLKERPPLDCLSMALLVWSVVLMGFSYGASLAHLPLKIYFGSLFGSAINALGTLWDYSADKEAGMRTLATVFGKRGAAAFLSGLMFVSLFFSGIRDPAFRILMGYFLGAFLTLVIRDDEKLAGRLAQMTVPVIMICGCVLIYEKAKPYLPALGVNLG